METIKSYTDIEQSKKLAEILPIESADMSYQHFIPEFFKEGYCPSLIKKEEDDDIPCWSLAALLSVLELPTLEKCNIGKDKTGWMVTVYHNNSRYDSFFYNEPVDACYEMILKLHELKML